MRIFYVAMITRIDRRTYLNTINAGDTEALKAIAFAIRAKSVRVSSVFKDWSYASIALKLGCSYNTARKRVKKLQEMGLVELKNEKGHPYLVFKRLRSKKVHTRYHGTRYPRNRDVIVSKLDTSSLKNIETGLRALLIVVIEKGKDIERHRPIRGKLERGSRSIRRVNPYFHDYGISRKTLTRRLHCGNDTLTKVIAHGEKQKLFVCHHGEKVTMLYKKGKAKDAFAADPELQLLWGYATNSCFGRREPNRYELVR